MHAGDYVCTPIENPTKETTRFGYHPVILRPASASESACLGLHIHRTPNISRRVRLQPGVHSASPPPVGRNPTNEPQKPQNSKRTFPASENPMRGGGWADSGRGFRRDSGELCARRNARVRYGTDDCRRRARKGAVANTRACSILVSVWNMREHARAF